MATILELGDSPNSGGPTQSMNAGDSFVTILTPSDTDRVAVNGLQAGHTYTIAITGLDPNEDYEARLFDFASQLVYLNEATDAIQVTQFGTVQGIEFTPEAITFIFTPIADGNFELMLGHVSGNGLGIVAELSVTETPGAEHSPTDNSEYLFVNSDSPLINMLAGDDWLFANSATGNATLYGGAGNDDITDSENAGVIYGEDGNDTLRGNAGNDTVFGGAGDDYAHGGSGNDTVDGGDGNDQVIGGWGFDLLRGGDGDDYLQGELHNDTLIGGAGNDTLYGGPNDDAYVITPNSGTDLILNFWEGNNVIVVRQIGISSIDQMSITDGETGAVITFSEGNSIELGGFWSSQVGTQHFVFADPIPDTHGEGQFGGTNEMDRLFGGAGDDSIRGFGGADLIYGGDGKDVINGHNENDTIYGEAGNDVLTGNAQDDYLDGGEGNDRLFGGLDNDTLVGGAGNDQLEGGSGDDVLDGGTGRDTLTGGTGADVFVFDWGGKADVITDFEDGIDLLDLSGRMATNIEDLRLLQNGMDALIGFETGATLTLENFDIANLDVSDFIF